MIRVEVIGAATFAHTDWAALEKPRRRKAVPPITLPLGEAPKRKPRAKMPPALPEHDVQCEIAKALTALGFFVQGSANGAHFGGNRIRAANQMRRLKAAGLKVGYPDLAIYTRGGRHGLIEVKKRGENVLEGDDQDKLRVMFQGWGFPWAVAHSVDEALAALRAWNWL